MEEKTGLDLLKEILQKLDFIEKKITVLEQNIKSIANSSKLSELLERGSAAKVSGWKMPDRSTPGLPNIKPGVPNIKKPGVPDIKKPKIPDIKTELAKAKIMTAGFKNFAFEPTDAAKMANNGQDQKRMPLVKNIVVKGKMVTNLDGKSSPLSNVSVKIFDDKDALVKETRTNRAGHWISHLPPGKYVALFEGDVEGKKLVPQNRNFIVPENMPEGKNEIEVS